MVKKFKKLPLSLKIFFTIAFIFFTAVVFVAGQIAYVLYKEPTEHDRLPVILYDQVKMSVVSNSLYENPEYANGVNCTPDQLEAVYKFVIKPRGINFDPVGIFPSCLRYPVEKGTFYWLRPHWAFEYVIFEKLSGEQLLVIYDNGKPPKYQNIDTGSYYPGIDFFDMKSNGKDVIFVYSGYNNPRKIIRLSVN